jgi:hypothetical protein
MQSDLHELIKHHLSCLPEVKQEIQYYLELIRDGNPFSKLQNILLELEEFPNIQELLKRDDIEELGQLSSKLNNAKTVARTEILTLRTNLELGLNNWRIGWHPVKDSSGHEQRVDHVWAVNILPSFDVPARIAVLHQPTYSHIVFAVCASPFNVSSSVAQVKLPKSWVDPLDSILCQLNIFHGTLTPPQDEIGYDFYNLSWASESHIHFYDPVDLQFVELEKCFFNVAETVVNKVGQHVEKDYLIRMKSWHS